MNTNGIDQYTPSNHHEPMTGVNGSQPHASRESFGAAREPFGATHKPFGATESAANKQASGAPKATLSIDTLLKFANDLKTKAQNVPYLIPIAAGGVGFTLGVLASSRILRKVALLGGAYGVRYAIQNAPKDEILSFAKKVVTDAFHAANAA